VRLQILWFLLFFFMLGIVFSAVSAGLLHGYNQQHTRAEPARQFKRMSKALQKWRYRPIATPTRRAGRRLNKVL
jgi:hypothetical protein